MEAVEKNKTVFQETKIGIVPDDWEVVRIQKLIDEKRIISHLDGNHGALYPKSNEFTDEGVPYVAANSFINNRVDFTLCKRLPMERATLFKKGIAKNGDVLFAHNATVGPVALLETNLEFVVLSTTATYFRLDNTSIDSKYWLQFLSSSLFKRQYEKVMKQSTRSQVPITAQRKFFAVVPSFTEQRLISSILSTWDTAIEKTQNLIKQLKLRKKGLMQQLLTGKKRLRGFEEEDVTLTKLKGLLKEQSVRNKSLKTHRVLSVTNSRGFINQSEQFDREVASKDLSNYKIVRKGQFAYNPSRVNVGSLDLLRNFDEGLLSPMYIIFETDDEVLNPEFLYYQLKTWWFIGHIPQFVQGSVRDSLSFDGLESMSFFIPSLDEQKAIVAVLETADEEISAYQKRLEELNEQKKGLMQQLLTGQKRVKV